MKFESEKILLNVLVFVIIIQIGSILTTKLFGVSVLKLGFAILLIILASVMAVVINASFGYRQGMRVTDLLYIGFLIGLGVAVFYFAPHYFPDIFSVIGGKGVFSIITP
jgi:hypothetical protein